jgi:DNA-binding CsgD family transcriptional regulator/PAS domain-containing protein
MYAPTLRTQTGEVVSLATFRGEFDYAAVLASDFYRDWAAPQGQIDGIQATLERTGSGLALLAAARHRDQGVAGPTEFRRMRLIAPHFRRAFLIGKAIDLHKVEAAAFAETISGLATAVFLLNAGGGLVHANKSAEAMLRAEDPVRVSRGLLLAFDGRAHKALTRAFAAARTGDAAGGGGGSAVPLLGKDGRHFVAHVLPLTAGRRREAEASLSAVAALFVREATVDLGAAIAAATQLYGFTPTEERVLRGVIELGGLPAVASMLGVSRRTAQTHLERLFAKTGTHRQADLARLIAGYDSPAQR